MNRNQKYIYPGPLWIPAQWLTGSPCKIKFTSLTQVLNSLIEAFFKNFISIIFSFRENGHQRAGMTLALNFCCRNYQLWTVTTSQVKCLSDNSSPGNNFNLGQATCLFFFWFLHGCQALQVLATIGSRGHKSFILIFSFIAQLVVTPIRFL